METLTREQVRRVDRIAIEELGIPGVVLMENAGRGCAEAILAELRGDTSAPASILCGGGNNGGDGYVIARHLVNAGVACIIYAAVVPDKLTGDAAVHAGIARRMGIAIEAIATAEQLQRAEASWRRDRVLVDALSGTGFRGDVRPEMARVIEACNAAKLNHPASGIVVAADVPSGLDCDTGRPSNATVKADLTVTFVAAKPGFLLAHALPYVGRLVVAGIGTPPALIERARQVAP